MPLKKSNCSSLEAMSEHIGSSLRHTVDKETARNIANSLQQPDVGCISVVQPMYLGTRERPEMRRNRKFL